VAPQDGATSVSLCADRTTSRCGHRIATIRDAPAHRACVVLGLAIAPVTLAVAGDEERETKTAAPRPEV